MKLLNNSFCNPKILFKLDNEIKKIIRNNVNIIKIFIPNNMSLRTLEAPPDFCCQEESLIVSLIESSNV